MSSASAFPSSGRPHDGEARACEQASSRASESLPELLDAKALRLELGVTRAAAEALMRRLPIVSIEGLRKVYVRRDDVRRYLDSRTFAKDRVPV